eukprot:5120654-Karenia_brevis.AAC.1
MLQRAEWPEEADKAMRGVCNKFTIFLPKFGEAKRRLEKVENNMEVMSQSSDDNVAYPKNVKPLSLIQEFTELDEFWSESKGKNFSI